MGEKPLIKKRMHPNNIMLLIDDLIDAKIHLSKFPPEETEDRVKVRRMIEEIKRKLDEAFLSNAVL